MKNKEKKGHFGCFKFILVFFAIYLGVATLVTGGSPLTGNPKKTGATEAPVVSAKAPTAAPTKSQTPKITATPTVDPTPTATLPDAPVLAGSQAYDFILSLKERGIAKPDTKTTDWGYEWISDSALVDDSVAMYSIRANRKHEIAYVSITVRGDAANWLLPFCATLPYTDNDPQAAHKWVEEHLTGKDASIQIGNAVYGIYPHANDTGAMLTIEAAGYQDWCLDQIK